MALEAATARRDELQQLLAQDKDHFIEEQAVLAQQADVTYSPSPASTEVSIAVQMHTTLPYLMYSPHTSV